MAQVSCGELGGEDLEEKILSASDGLVNELSF